MALPDSADRAKVIMDAMESIELNYDSLRGVLPKNEYQKLDNDTLGDILRLLNPDELKQVSGDVFGRIYEYFLTQFADQKAHDNGEFFTPVSLVSLIAHILDPQRGTVLDPACGSGGMFVQSARTVEEHGQSPTEQLTFRGLEKNATTIRLAKMNLAVHGLEGDVQQAITYYDDPHELVGKADYVMANPPFNVDEIDAAKVKTDPRLPFGLPGVNKKDKVSNGNYVWISYFYGYLNETGRAGFVMSSQVSSAGRGRQKLVETGDVDIMIAIRSNFFYTRTVPCELWFLNRAKPEEHRDTVLMTGLLDAPGHYRRGQVSVMGQDQIHHIGPPAWRVPQLMANLLAWLGSTAEHPLIVSSIFHYEFEFIHPFEDGNGRMGRLWQTLVLTRWKPLFAHIPVESLIHAKQDEYYEAIRRSSAEGESTSFIAFMLDTILEAMYTPQVAPQATPQVRRLLSVLEGEMSRQEIQQALGLKDRKSLGQRYLLPALRDDYIEMTHPDTPNARNQKYRPTPRGRQVWVDLNAG